MTFKFNPLTGELDLFQRRSSDPTTSVWNKFSVTANQSSTTTIDSIAMSAFSSIKYIISVEESGRVKTLEMLICNDDGVLKDAVFGRIGASLNFAIVSTQSAGTFNLSLTNNETNNLNLNIARLLL